MSYVGDIRLGDTIDIKFTTRQISGAPFTLAGTPVISAYVGNSTTEITAGITLTTDFDGRTGLNNARVVATGGNGFATASDYQLVITTGTVNGVSVVGEVIAEFSIEHRSALMPATSARTLVVDANGLADANAVKLGPTGSGSALTARDIGASVLLSAGSGAGQLDFASGVVKANLVQILATALTETAGQIAAAFKQFFDVASPTGTMKAITNVVTTTNLTTNNDKTGYSLTSAYDPAKTAAQAGDAMALTSGERNSTADALLDRNMATGTDSGSPTVRTVRQALRFLRNKWSVSGTALTVTKEDDTTASWTGVVTATPGADPITGNDPA